MPAWLFIDACALDQHRFVQMPIRCLLVDVRGAEKYFFAKMRAHELHPHRQALRVEANREG